MSRALLAVLIVVGAVMVFMAVAPARAGDNHDIVVQRLEVSNHDGSGVINVEIEPDSWRKLVKHQSQILIHVQLVAGGAEQPYLLTDAVSRIAFELGNPAAETVVVSLSAQGDRGITDTMKIGGVSMHSLEVRVRARHGGDAPGQSYDCRAALTKRGLDVSWAPACDGVDARCAVAVINNGRDPSWLSACKDVEGRCAEAVVTKGLDGSWIQACKGVDGTCAAAVVNKGLDPSWIQACKNVDGACAAAVVNRGLDPSWIQACQNVDSACAVATLEQGKDPSALSLCHH